VNGLTPGSYEIWVTAPGYLDSPRTTVVAGSTQVSLSLRPAARIEGNIVDAKSGEPVSRASLILTGNPELVIGGRGRMTRVRSAHGDFAFPGVPPGNHFLVVRADGFAETVHGPLSVSAGQVLDGVEIRLGRGATIRGQVVDSIGKGIEGCKVTLVRQMKVADGTADFLRPMLQANAPVLHSTSDSDGRYELGGLREGNWQLQVTHERFATDRTLAVFLAKDEDRKVETIALLEGATLKGTVKSADGRPDGRARLLVQNIRFPDIRREVATSQDGTYEVIGLPAGDYRITMQQREGGVAFGDLLLSARPEGAKIWTLRPGETVIADL
jgi:hypothetical protein